MFVKIENHKDPSEYELVNVDDIDSVRVTRIPTELADTVSYKSITYDTIANYRQMLYEKFPNIQHVFSAALPYNKVSQAINDATDLSDDDKGQCLELYRELRRVSELYNDWVDKKTNMSRLAPCDDQSCIYMVYLKSANVPIYTTMSTVNTLNRVLCNQGVDTNVRDDNR